MLPVTSAGLTTPAYAGWRASPGGKPWRSAHQTQPSGLHTTHSIHERLVGTSQTKAFLDRIKLGLAVAMLTALTGCIGVVGDGGGYVGGGGWWWDDGGWWGGGHGFDRGRDVHAYGARGATSRGAAHGGGGGHGDGGGRR